MYTQMYMNYITTTQLRTQSSRLIETLLAGKSVDIIHRSKVVGEIKPKRAVEKVFNAEKVLKLTKKLDLPKLTYTEREKRYRRHLENRYGKGIS